MTQDPSTSETNRPSERRGFGPDRRGAERGGKYDRRRNRCGRCRFFVPPTTGEGYCQKHEKPMATDDFACMLYEGAG